ncbi:endothelin-converting enzyme 1-like [Paramacrobiotus metropolitanus]|uniref:endothelin-converting enzyme 1-like n=1 Tax=Paramacrobiotus metropolitanus TaxID=2943436 RepID=UPI00244616C7|nr:endothelin-converting enzyme 1-like [Paramacrobiotus metropolitanus]
MAAAKYRTQRMHQLGLWSVAGYFVFLATTVNANAIDSQNLTSVCTSHLCQRVARAIISNMDSSADPCTDFFDYACRSWNVSHPLLPGENTNSQYGIYKKKIANQTKALFESGKYANPTEKKALDLYNQCNKEKPDKRPGGQVVLAIVDELMGGWSLLDSKADTSRLRLDEILGRLQKNDIQTFSSLHVDENILSSDQNILYIMPANKHLERSRMFSRHEEMDDELPEKRNNTIHTAETALFKPWNDTIALLIRDSGKKDVQMADVQSRLENILLLEVVLSLGVKGATNTSYRAAFGDFSKLPYRSKFLANCVQIFNAMLRASSVNYVATANTTVGITMLAYVQNLDKQMEALEADGDKGRRIVADWLWWKAIDHYLDRMSAEYSGNSDPTDCLTLVKEAMPLTLSEMFFKAYITKETMQKAKALVSDISQGMRDAVLLQAAWMDRPTQLAAVEKLNNVLQMVGFPHEFLENSTILDQLYKNIQVKPTFFETLQTIDQSTSYVNLNKLTLTDGRANPYDPEDLTMVNAQMQPDRNRMVIPASMLQPPVFYDRDMDIVNYARLGFMIGHEFTHGFDDGGRVFGKDGKPTDWWTSATHSNYVQKKNNFIQFYNNISTPGGNINGKLTLNENIADNGGYRAAYQAFHTFMDRTGYRIKLPGLEALSIDQLFWLIAAQTTCSTSTTSYLKLLVTQSVHAPLKVRVLGPYMNNQDFSRAYNCSIGSPMNPQVKGW